jgi:HAD superfamily hydrolase (TIGR01490 family)
MQRSKNGGTLFVTYHCISPDSKALTSTQQQENTMRPAAIFDLDGTLIPNTSAERTFFFHLLRTGGLSVFDVIKLVKPVLSFHGNLHRVTVANKAYLRHKKVEKFEAVARKFFEPQVKNLVFRNMAETIEKHREQDDILLLLSGTLNIIAECFVRALHLDGARTTDLETRNGAYTGRTIGVVPYGFGKIEALRELRQRYEFDQNHTTLYANSYSDRYVLNAVEKPVAVNPDKRLAQYARKNNWRIIDSTAKP